MQVRSLGQEDPLEEDVETHSSILAWSQEDLEEEMSPGGGHGNPLQYSCLKNPIDRGGLQSMELQRAGHN